MKCLSMIAKMGELGLFRGESEIAQQCVRDFLGFSESFQITLELTVQTHSAIRGKVCTKHHISYVHRMRKNRIVLYFF